MNDEHLEKEIDAWRSLCNDYERLTKASMTRTDRALMLLPGGVAAGVCLGMMLGREFPDWLFSLVFFASLAVSSFFIVRSWRHK